MAKPNKFTTIIGISILSSVFFVVYLRIVQNAHSEIPVDIALGYLRIENPPLQVAMVARIKEIKTVT